MPAPIALFICILFILVILLIEKKNNITTTFALWLPTFWMMICASRPLGAWFSVSFTGGEFNEGSLIDRFTLLLLIFLSIVTLLRRNFNWSDFFNNHLIMIIFFSYLGISVFWSDYLFVSLKRYVKLIGVLPVALVILTEGKPIFAIQRVMRRCSYILIPLSIVLIKYYPNLGVKYGRWSGELTWTGVALTKNTLGQLCLISSIFLFWSLLSEKRKFVNGPTSRNFIDIIVISLSIYMMVGTPSGAYSATSVTILFACFISIFLMVRNILIARKVSQVIIFLSVTFWFFMIFLDSFLEKVALMVGRDPTLTGRSEIWTMVLRDAKLNPIFGTGFGGYFNTGNEFSMIYGYTGHNGLLDIFVETGYVGCLFLIFFLVSFYNKIVREFEVNIGFGILGTMILFISIINNYTESIYLKSTSYIWNVFIFIYIISSNLKLRVDIFHSK